MRERPKRTAGERCIGTAHTVQELIDILNTEVPSIASIEIATSYHCVSAEVWYDESTTTVIFK
jgi:hypothetical protein